MNKQRPDPDCNFRNIDHLMFEGRSGVDDLAAWRDTRKQSLSERCLHLVTLTIAQRSYVSQVWWHPWVRLERRTRAILADRLSLGASSVSYTHLRAHETPEHLVCRLLL